MSINPGLEQIPYLTHDLDSIIIKKQCSPRITHSGQHRFRFFTRPPPHILLGCFSSIIIPKTYTFASSHRRVTSPCWDLRQLLFSHRNIFSDSLYCLGLSGGVLLIVFTFSRRRAVGLGMCGLGDLG